MAALNRSLLEPGHISAIGALAEETNHSVDEVTDVYVAVLEDLKSSARIKDYLVVLTSKKVRDALLGNEMNKKRSDTHKLCDQIGNSPCRK